METTWRKLIAEEMQRVGDDKLIACTLSESELDIVFDANSGVDYKGAHFTAWSETRVYFPVVYDGAEWVQSVPRNPCDEATEHVGM